MADPHEPDDGREPVPVETMDSDVSDSEERGPVAPLAIGALVFLLIAGAVAYLLFLSGDNSTYSTLVDEVVDNPEDFEDRDVRVEGELRQGSILFRDTPCEWRFVLHKNDREMPVSFSQCVVPDTFRDGEGLTVTVQGRMGNDGRFVANQVVPRCPSKYEMQQRLEAGEEMPHAANPLNPS
jgi:cytochrome c-type biogenesis protein CcmE